MRRAKRRWIIFAAAAAAAAILIILAVIYRSNSSVDVCIDPGHGDYDSGAQFEGRNEKDDNLALALKVSEELERRGISTVMTRDSDEFISLSKRCKIANSRKAKLFVSLHRNSAQGNADGVEIWIHSDDPEPDRALAQNILNELDSVGIALNRGVKAGYARTDGQNYYVNNRTKMPSCLVELGFITSKTDNRLLDEHLDSYALAIADGIEKTLKGDT